MADPRMRGVSGTTLELTLVLRSPPDLHGELHRNLEHADLNEYKARYQVLVEEFKALVEQEFSQDSDAPTDVQVTESAYSPRLSSRPMGGGVPPFETVVSVALAFKDSIELLQALLWSADKIRRVYRQSTAHFLPSTSEGYSGGLVGLPLIDAEMARILCAADCANRHGRRLTRVPTVQSRDFEEGPFLRSQYFVEVPAGECHFVYLISQYGLPLDHYSVCDETSTSLPHPPDLLGLYSSSELP
jgi:hypothetical protein